MDREKRIGDDPIPANLEELLSEAQRRMLPGIKYAGWEPRFLRQQAFQPQTLVMHNSNDDRIGVMDADGRLKYKMTPKFVKKMARFRIRHQIICITSDFDHSLR